MPATGLTPSVEQGLLEPPARTDPASHLRYVLVHVPPVTGRRHSFPRSAFGQTVVIGAEGSPVAAGDPSTSTSSRRGR